jgi:hypothetical protein
VTAASPVARQRPANAVRLRPQLRRFLADRDQVEALIEALVSYLDVIDGDPDDHADDELDVDDEFDREDDDPAEDDDADEDTGDHEEPADDFEASDVTPDLFTAHGPATPVRVVFTPVSRRGELGSPVTFDCHRRARE